MADIELNVRHIRELAVVRQPRSELDLAAAATAGVLDEGGTGVSSSVNWRRETLPTQSWHVMLLRLAISGGMLLIGIADHKDRDRSDPLTALRLIPLAGLAELVEQISLAQPGRL
ncbi:MAG TPA: hypothetical protein VM848_16090 [Acidimicrobiia bacterium]|nr:hypothetical protein [Acidimicrobiia bacterium]